MSEYLGVDVAKDSLVVWMGGRAHVLKNKRPEIRRFVRSLPEDAAVWIEATSTYHSRTDGFTKSYEYDDAGRTTSVTTPTETLALTYDYEGQVKTFSRNGTLVATYSYNGLGARARRAGATWTENLRRDGADATANVTGVHNDAVTQQEFHTPGISQRNWTSVRPYYFQRNYASRGE